MTVIEVLEANIDKLGNLRIPAKEIETITAINEVSHDLQVCVQAMQEAEEEQQKAEQVQKEQEEPQDEADAQ